jgi:two-component system NtrC family sensor kinase
MPDERSEVWILCPTEPVAALEALAARSHPELELVLERGEGPIAERVRLIRRARGGVALGVVTPDESAALLALESGADEGIAIDRLDQRSAPGFVDRVLLRARLRAEQEEMRALYVHHEKLAALGTLVAGVAHEVNNPLTALLLTVEALKLRAPFASEAPAEAAEMLDEIEISARSIASVVRDLKVFSRPDSDDALPEVVDLPALIDQVLRVVGRQIRSFARLELDYEPGLPEVVVPAARVAQVFTNILVNASHAVSQVSRPAHRVRIRARADAHTVAVSISDSGPGIPEAAVSRIFEPFFTTKERGAGTGLGLSISRSILRRFGGDLLAESVHGDGATFTVSIPRPSSSELASARERARSSPVETQPTARRQRVLVVEADGRVLRAIARALEMRCDVVGAADAQEAIERLGSGPGIDAILADVSGPGFAGLSLEKWLAGQANPLLSKLIFMMAEEQDAPAELSSRGTPVLFKPIGQTALLRALFERLG